MLRRRILAAATATVLALGMSVGGAGAALASTPAGVTVTERDTAPFVCNDPFNYNKPNSWDSANNAGEELEWGSVSWSENGAFTWTINPGYDVDFCIKGGQTIVEIDTSVYSGTSYSFKSVHGNGISHAGFRVNSTPPPPSVIPSFTTSDERCEDGVLLVGGSITVDTQNGAISYEVTDADGNVVSDLSNLPPGTYTVTPTATGEATLDLDGYDSTAVIGAFDGDCELPPLGTASVAFTYAPPTCELAQSVEVNDVSTANATLTSTDTSVPGQVTFVFTADEDSVFSESEPPTFSGTGPEPVVLSVDISDDFTQLTVVVELLGANEELCEEIIEPSIRATLVASECDTDVPYIIFDVALDDPQGRYTGDGTVTLVFADDVNELRLDLGTLNSSGEIAGRIMWPGASVDEDGVASGWPGWELIDGEWVNVGDGNFGWTRSLDKATIEINPELIVDLSYPPATPDCLVDPPFEFPTLPLVEPNVTTTQATCAASGTYTLSNTEGVQWVVDGENANAGTYTAAPGSNVSIEAIALDGFGFAPETQTEWELEFAAAPTNCDDVDLPTLALTGASGMLGSVGIAALLITLTGIGVVATRRRVEV